MEQISRPNFGQQSVRTTNDDPLIDLASQQVDSHSLRQVRTTTNTDISPASQNGMFVKSVLGFRTRADTNTKQGSTNQVAATVEDQQSHIPSLESLSLSSLLNCEELLDLYSNTRINFLDAESQLRTIGNVPVEVYQELDAVQKHLNYKSDHYFYQLINVSRSSPDFLLKLKDKARNFPASNIDVDRQSVVVTEPESEKESSEDTHSGSKKDEDHHPTSSSLGLTNPHVIQINSIRAIPESGRPPKNSNPVVSKSPQTTPSESTTISESNESTSLSRDMDLYLKKVAQLRGSEAAEREAERLTERSQPLERVAASPQTILDLNTIMNEINTKSIRRDDIARFFKNFIASLKSLPLANVAEIFTNLVMGINKDTYGSQYDARYIITNELLGVFEEGHEIWRIISGRGKTMARIANWLRFDLKLERDTHANYCFDFIERVHLSNEQLKKCKLNDVLNYTRNKGGKFHSIIERIQKNANGQVNESQKSNNTAAAPKTSTSKSTPKVSTNSSFSRRPIQPEPQNSSKPQTVQPARTTATTNSSGSIQPATVATSNETITSQGLVPKSDPKLPSKSASTFGSRSLRAPEAPKKWSFGSYVNSTKRKVSASESAPKEPEVAKPIESQEQNKTCTSLKSILTKRNPDSRNGNTKPKKTVRFSNSNEVKEFESEMVIVHGLTPESEHKRAREMETSEGNTLKRHKPDALEVAEALEVVPEKERSIAPIKHYTVCEYLHRKFEVPPPINFSLIEDFSRDDISVAKGGKIPIQVFKDKHKPTWKRPKLVRGVNTKPMDPIEPKGLIVELQHLDTDPSEEIQREITDKTETEVTNQTMGEDAIETSNVEAAEGDEDDDYVIPEIDELSKEADSKTESATPAVVAEEEISHEVPNAHETNKNVDKDVLALLDDDEDMFDGHAPEDDLEHEDNDSPDEEYRPSEIHQSEDTIEGENNDTSVAQEKDKLSDGNSQEDLRDPWESDDEDSGDDTYNDDIEEVPKEEFQKLEKTFERSAQKKAVEEEEHEDEDKKDEEDAVSEPLRDANTESIVSDDAIEEVNIKGNKAEDQEVDKQKEVDSSIETADKDKVEIVPQTNQEDADSSKGRDEESHESVDEEKCENSHVGSHGNDETKISPLDDYDSIVSDQAGSDIKLTEDGTDQVADKERETADEVLDVTQPDGTHTDNGKNVDHEQIKNSTKNVNKDFQNESTEKIDDKGKDEVIESTATTENLILNNNANLSSKKAADDTPPNVEPLHPQAPVDKLRSEQSLQSAQNPANKDNGISVRPRGPKSLEHKQMPVVRNEVRHSLPTRQQPRQLDSANDRISPTLKVILPTNNNNSASDSESSDSNHSSPVKQNEGTRILKIKGAANEAHRKSPPKNDLFPTVSKRLSDFEVEDRSRKLNTYEKNNRGNTSTHRGSDYSVHSFYNPTSKSPSTRTLGDTYIPTQPRRESIELFSSKLHNMVNDPHKVVNDLHEDKEELFPNHKDQSQM